MNDEDWDALLPPIRAGAAFEEILRDLIADLNAMPATCAHCADVAATVAADRAEARLKRLADD